MRLLLLNGPNLNLLGTRSPEVYGTTTLAALEAACRRWASELDATLESFQSNHEGELIDRLHDARSHVDGVVFNPGAFTHTSYALHDAIEAVELPVVEVHISNVEAREPWRAVSVVRPACIHTIFGRGVDGYCWAIRHLHWNGISPATRLAYGPAADQQVMVRGHAEPVGLAVLVHGGFWRAPWGFDTIEGPAVDLHDAGLATAVVEYRRTGRNHPGPAMIVEDVHDAVEAAGRATGVGLDRTVIVGHSAGGHLAVLAAARLQPRLVLPMAGILDLERGATLGEGASGEFLAGADPADFSPTTCVPIGAPVVAITARDDAVVPATQADRFSRLAKRAGDDVSTVEVSGDHYSFLDPTTDAWQTVRHIILERLTTGGGH